MTIAWTLYVLGDRSLDKNLECSQGSGHLMAKSTDLKLRLHGRLLIVAIFFIFLHCYHLCTFPTHLPKQATSQKENHISVPVQDVEIKTINLLCFSCWGPQKIELTQCLIMQ